MKKTMVSAITIGITPLAAVIVFLSAFLSLAGCENSLQNPDVINIAAIMGVTVPAAGGIPAKTITETGQYTGTVTWKITGGADLTGSFAASTSYTATITLTPKTGYTLQGVEENFFTVAGATASNSANSGVITAVFPIDPIKIINIKEIGVTFPVTGKTPATKITETAQYTGEVIWNITDGYELMGSFVVSTSYTAIITLTPKTGYTLQGVEADFFTVAWAKTSNSANSGVITAVFPSTIGTASNPSKVNITNIALNKQPATGEDQYAVEVIETWQYSGYISSWAPDDGSFKYNGQYTATITLTTKTGCTLAGVTKDFFSVAGAIKTTNPAIPAVVPDDDFFDPYTIDIIATFNVSLSKIDTEDPIQGLSAPETDATPAPATAIIETEQYKGTVAWYEKGKSAAFTGPTFGPDIEYTAKITLWANTGYTFKDVPGNSFTVDDAIVGKTAKSVSHPAGTGSTIVITVVYNNTEAKQIDLLEIEGVILPQVGNNPKPIDKKNYNNEQYTAEISWPIPSTSKFAPGEIYGATIYVTPKAGYTLTGVGAFIVEGATCSNDADSGIVSVVFPATAANPDRFIDVSDAPATGRDPETIVFGFTGCYIDDTKWSPALSSDGNFNKNQIYKATLTISTESDDFTLYGIDKNYFVVSDVPGTSTSYAPVSSTNYTQGKVTIEFPKTGPE